MLDLLTDGFILRALMGGLIVAAMAGPLGCFVVWRRMSYFGDTMAHASLLGVSFGLALAVQPIIGVVAVVILAAIALFWLERLRWLASDTALGMLAHGSLALGLVVAAAVPGLRVDLSSYLFGDILAVQDGDLVWMGGGAIVILVVLAAIWRPLLAATVQPDLARAEGIEVARVRLIFTLLVALLIAAAMKIVGVLLVTALLIIPAATARRFSRSPESMAVIAALLGMLSVVFGLLLSLTLDTPSGPSIVVAAIAQFLVTMVLGLAAPGQRRP